MGCLILCIGSLHSLLRCSVEFTVLIYFIVNTFHTPETKVMDILIQQIIDQLQCAGNILTVIASPLPELNAPPALCHWFFTLSSIVIGSGI